MKKNIETSQGQNVYPSEQQMLIHQGKVLKDDTTLQDNKVSENSFIVVMLSKVYLFALSCGSAYFGTMLLCIGSFQISMVQSHR